MGQGRVHLGGTPDVSVRVDNSTLNVVGQPGTQGGPGVVPIVYVPSAELQTPDVSQLILDAIDRSALSGLTTYVDETGSLIVEGAEDVQGITQKFVPGIRDLAGNNLQTNLDELPFDVRYFIELPAPLDFGDTPDPPYQTLLSSDGPRHVLVPGVYLGTSIDAELDGHTDSVAGGDLFDDGVQFGGPLTPRGRVNITVLASTSGYVDGWIDYNADGIVRCVARASLQECSGQPRRQYAAGDLAGRLRWSAARSGASASAPRAAWRRPDVRAMAKSRTMHWRSCRSHRPWRPTTSTTLDEDTTLNVPAPGLLANDQNPQGGSLSAVLATPPAHGTLTLNADGSFSYTPDADYAGTDTFTYRAETQHPAVGPGDGVPGRQPDARSAGGWRRCRVDARRYAGDDRSGRERFRSGWGTGPLVDHHCRASRTRDSCV